MCMCFDIPVYIGSFFGGDLHEGLKKLFIIEVVMALVEAIMTLVVLVIIGDSDVLTKILFSASIVVCLNCSLWSYLAFNRNPTSDNLLVTEYTILTVPLPALSLFGYLMLVQEIFYYVNTVVQLLIAVSNLYFSVCAHSLFIDKLYEEKENEPAPAP